MATAKEHISEIIRRQPDDSTYDDIVRELAFDLNSLGKTVALERSITLAPEGIAMFAPIAVILSFSTRMI